MKKHLIKKKETPCLDFYNRSMKSRVMTRKIPFSGYHYGLCSWVHAEEIDKKLLHLVTPTTGDISRLFRENKDTVHWGSDAEHGKIGEFTPLRQNLVLFMAAINGEL